MLDNRYLRDNLETVAARLKPRGFILDVEKIRALEAKRKDLQTQTQALQNERNVRSKEIGIAKSKGQNIDSVLESMEALAGQVNTLESKLTEVQQELDGIYSLIPNLPHESVPLGKSDTDNVEIRKWGEPKKFSFTPQDHVSLGKEYLDFDAAAKIAGARFVVMYGKIARLHRALAQFMLDLHSQEHGYEEVYVPYLVNTQSLYGTGQYPKLAEDSFRIPAKDSIAESEFPLSNLDKNRDFWLIPTSEVSVSNLVRERILEMGELPKKYVCFSPCFRSEAGSYGKDLKGMIRQHQFDKVEMIQIVEPSQSYIALEEMLKHAEKVLQLLELPYRIVNLCTGDLGFSAAKTYDLEVWLPGQDRYREISSCSNTESFQARRLQARYRDPQTKKPEYLHTLNGSGLAVGRTLIAVMENYQDEQGRIEIPKVLRPYMAGMERI